MIVDIIIHKTTLVFPNFWVPPRKIETESGLCQQDDDDDDDAAAAAADDDDDDENDEDDEDDDEDDDNDAAADDDDDENDDDAAADDDDLMVIRASAQSRINLTSCTGLKLGVPRRINLCTSPRSI